ncbi:MAG: tRNA (guanosine(37)-N1)-methyltransferase TrmD [Candidatus Colwellbacteria bacterium]|nr:tRNA (guanosine(37)-N1)-methyltransferase TrmD [Candidatus Colwellbacteria bacterium]
MTFHIITLFPETIEPYLKSSIVGKAEQKGLVKVKYYNLLDFSSNKHKKVDDRPYGGGPGMVLQIEPIIKALNSALKNKSKLKVKVILFSPAGKQFTSKMAQSLASRYKHIVLIAGRYEGVDARLKKIIEDRLFAKGGKIDELSIGPYVLTGGELPAMLLVDTISRQIKGVLGKEESLEERRLGVGVPAYTRPEVFAYRGKKYRVPRVLTSGNHAEIQKWREKSKKGKS